MPPIEILGAASWSVHWHAGVVFYVRENLALDGAHRHW